MAGHSHRPAGAAEYRTQTDSSGSSKDGCESVLTRNNLVLPWSGRPPAAAIEATDRNDHDGGKKFPESTSNGRHKVDFKIIVLRRGPFLPLHLHDSTHLLTF